MGNIRRFARENRSACRGMAVVAVLALWGGAAAAQPYHAADVNRDFSIQLSELLRVVQIFNVGSYHCLPGSEDGYGAGDGPRDCAHHTADTDAGWSIDLSEMLRVTQLHNAGIFHVDCFAPDLAAPGHGAHGDCRDGLVSFRALPDDLYAPGEPVDITITISRELPSTGSEYVDPITAMGIEVDFPSTDWEFVGVAPGSVPVVKANEPATLALAWIEVPRLPYTFTFTLLPKYDVQGAQWFSIRLLYRRLGASISTETDAALHPAGLGGTGGGGETPCTNVAFFSPRLHNAVMNALGNPPGGLRLCDLEALESLDLSNSGIEVLSDMHVFRNLRYLNLSGNELLDLSGIEYMPALGHVDLSNNQLGHAYELLSANNFPALSLVEVRGNPLFQNHYCHVAPMLEARGITVLQDGECTDGHPVNFDDPAVANAVTVAMGTPGLPVYAEDVRRIQSLDLYNVGSFGGLQYLTGLRSLGAHGYVSDLTPLSGLVNLRYLYLSSNRISDLTPLSGLVNLRTLNLSSNQISDLTPLSDLVNLHTLDLSYNRITDLTPLAGLVNLSYLRLGSNQISDVTPLSDLVNLRHLYLHNNQITDLTPLTGLVNLRTLYLFSNPISDLAPLLENEGIGAHTFIYLGRLNVPEAALEQVEALRARGVRVYL